MKTYEKWTVLEHQEPALWQDSALGILVPSEKTKRDYIRKEGAKILVAGAYLPDIYRVGLYVDGDLPNTKVGASILFNKHDAIEFKLDGKSYYAIRTEMCLAQL